MPHQRSRTQIAHALLGIPTGSQAADHNADMPVHGLITSVLQPSMRVHASVALRLLALARTLQAWLACVACMHGVRVRCYMDGYLAPPHLLHQIWTLQMINVCAGKMAVLQLVAGLSLYATADALSIFAILIPSAQNSC